MYSKLLSILSIFWNHIKEITLTFLDVRATISEILISFILIKISIRCLSQVPNKVAIRIKVTTTLRIRIAEL